MTSTTPIRSADSTAAAESTPHQSSAGDLGDVERRRTAVVGRGAQARIEAFPRSMVSAGHSTSLPVETNSISIDPELKDAWASRRCASPTRTTRRPRLRAFLAGPPGRDHARRRCAKSLARRDRGKRSWSSLIGHLPDGNDPATSVVDKHHRTHDVRNLFICDGSSFVTSGRGQPTMTIQALAFRAADHIGQFASATKFEAAARPPR